MENYLKDILRRQFAAAIDTMGHALNACPDELWQSPLWDDSVFPGGSCFWYVAYHAIFWCDMYLTGVVEGFAPPAPFDLNEFDPNGLLPERVFTKSELLEYLAYCRRKSRETILSLTDEKANQLCYFTWAKDGVRFAELLLDNMRHVQEHAAQLNMFLGQQAGISTGWVNGLKDTNPPV